MDFSIVIGTIGIGATVFSSLAAYRFVITARQERIQKSHESIIETLLTRLVNEKRVPTREELRRLGTLKSRENNHTVQDLLDEDEYLDLLYARVFESNIIEKDRREELLGLVSEALKQTKHPSTEERFAITSMSVQMKQREAISSLARIVVTTTTAIALMVALSSVMFDPSVLSGGDIEFLYSTIAIMGMMVVTSSMFLLVIRLRQKTMQPETTSIKKNRQFSENLEMRLREIAERKKMVVETECRMGEDANSGVIVFDFCISGEKKYFIEVKRSNRFIGGGSSSFWGTLFKQGISMRGDAKSRTVLIILDVEENWLNTIRQQLKGSWDLIISHNDLDALEKFIEQ